MRAPLQWLREHVEIGVETTELVRLLDLTGTAVESVTDFGITTPETIVVGKVLTAEPHPDADRLRVTSVDLGTGEPSTIVCGAPNVAAGQTVAVAPPGTTMAPGFTLDVRKLRGIPSHGMILSASELQLEEGKSDGILVLPDELEAGTPLGTLADLGGTVLELEITPNRPDCLGVFGVAREVGAVLRTPVGAPPWEQDPGPAAGPIAGFDVVVECPELCPRFTARLFEGVTVGPSPAWLKARLRAAGQRPINTVVDITNYVMLLTGQPVHAFDADRIAGGTLTVRRAADGETMATLDDVERTLDAEMVLIADGDGPTSVAGIMGGRRSEVQDDTTRVLFEAATWDGPNINRTMARLGLRSEAGARFEKSLPAEATMWAQAVGTRLLVELCDATVVGGTIDVRAPGAVPDEAPVVVLRDARMTSLLGVEVPRERAVAALERLGFAIVAADDEALHVGVPPWRRGDVTREADLVEEVGRLEALEDLPATLPANRTGQASTLTPLQRQRRRAVDALVGRGLHEVVGWSFTAPELADRLALPEDDPRRQVVVLENPMSEDQSVLRTTLLGSLLDAARHNAARGMPGAWLFEEGAVYLAAEPSSWSPGLPREVHALGALVGGDVFAAKGVLEALAGAVRAPVAVEQATEPFLHPGRAARVLAGDGAGTPVGWLGEVHPTVAARWDLGQVSAFEVDLDALLAHAVLAPSYADLTSFPEVRQDLAFVLAQDVPAARLVATIRAAGGGLLAGAEVFDVYTGTGIPEGHRSLAVRLVLRALDRTLSDEDVAPVREAIVAAVADELSGTLR